MHLCWIKVLISLKKCIINILFSMFYTVLDWYHSMLKGSLQKVCGTWYQSLCSVYIGTVNRPRITWHLQKCKFLTKNARLMWLMAGSLDLNKEHIKHYDTQKHKSLFCENAELIKVSRSCFSLMKTSSKWLSVVIDSRPQMLSVEITFLLFNPKYINIYSFDMA